MTATNLSTRHRAFGGSALLGDAALAALFGLVKFLIHVATNWRYGFHRDELYYLACAERLQWGYVDHPPFTPFVAFIARTLFGTSLAGLRFFSALAGAGVVVLTCLSVRQLGGGRLAQALAACAVIGAPLYLGANTLMQTVPFDQFVWVAACYLLLLLLKTGNARWWIPLGVTLGIGLLNKHTVLIFGWGLAVGLLLTSNRRWLRTPWPWFAAAIAFAFFLPNLLWQIDTGWPTIEFVRNNNANVRSESSMLSFLLLQIALIGPFALPIWLLGLYAFLSPDGAPYRMLGWLFLTVLLTFMLLGGKPYYPAPAYPILLAGGAVVIERSLARRPRRRFHPALVGGFLALVLLPALVIPPWLPRSTFVRYKLYQFSGDAADMFGWEDLVTTVTQIYRQLSPTEQARTTILARNYGQAGAVDILGRQNNLPHVVSGHNSYYLWGPPAEPADTVIAIGYTGELLMPFFEDVQQVGTITNADGVENVEYGRPILLCRRPRAPLRDIWPRLKHYN